MNWTKWGIFFVLAVTFPCYWLTLGAGFYPVVCLWAATIVAVFANWSREAPLINTLVSIAVFGVQALLYSIFIYIVAKILALAIHRSRSTALRVATVLIVIAASFSTWSLDIWGSRGFVDPTEPQSIFVATHRLIYEFRSWRRW